ncbi:head-tail connector protein [Bradyrhizobium sp. 18]|uniref:head-tail connector protein n=1 Tax=Bradyrhizobium sp. 18 TaxID=2782657 RepID=UPI00211125D8|nr:head-tail connector protein [Bradyrhizobium sp. 18]
MPVVVITPPAYALVSLEEAKAHLRVDFDDDDDYIESLVETVTNTLDGPGGWLGRALITQTLEWRGDEFGTCDIRLPYPPIASIVSVKYDDDDGAEQTVSSGDYRLVGQPSLPRIALAYGSSWPSTRSQSESVRIRYTAGYGTAVDSVPAPIRQAVLLMIAELYENRELTTDRSRAELPFSAMALLSTYRVFA